MRKHHPFQFSLLQGLLGGTLAGLLIGAAVCQFQAADARVERLTGLAEQEQIRRDRMARYRARRGPAIGCLNAGLAPTITTQSVTVSPSPAVAQLRLLRAASNRKMTPPQDGLAGHLEDAIRRRRALGNRWLSLAAAGCVLAVGGLGLGVVTRFFNGPRGFCAARCSTVGRRASSD